jgi:hypothetical protein
MRAHPARLRVEPLGDRTLPGTVTVLDLVSNGNTRRATDPNANSRGQAWVLDERRRPYGHRPRKRREVSHVGHSAQGIS